MNPRDRLIKVLDGQKPDRIPIFTLIPFGIEKGKLVPGPFQGYTDIDEWRKNDTLYIDLVSRMDNECDNIYLFRPECADAQNIFINPNDIKIKQKIISENKITMIFEAGKLQKTEVFQFGSGHKWVTEHLCKSIEEAVDLAEGDYYVPDCNIEYEESKIVELGNRGISWCTIPSPVMSVCRLFDPQDFLLFSAVYSKEIDYLMKVAFERTKKMLADILQKTSSPIIRFGGAEHATPPMMSLADFDRFVYNFDKPLMDMCHEKGKKVAVHCHGNIRYAVKRFVDMGADQLDPVEALPWGDISLEEIRAITKDRITLTGNIQFSEICSESQEHIRRRVRDIINVAGPERLIISTTGTPPEKINTKQYDNYNAMIDETISYRI